MCTEDEAHAQHLLGMRNTSFAQPVSDAVISSLQLLTREAVERKGELLRFAKIGVLSQRERHALNASQARAFARRTCLAVMARAESWVETRSCAGLRDPCATEPRHLP